ncbi:alpha/beta hydrolase family protein [Marilutibacter aestuarii]|nr:alpha/beta hydrolase [Lysobacter aestuarii]
MTSPDPHPPAAHAPPLSLHLRCKVEGGHAWHVMGRLPARPRASLLWLPALGVAARHYLPLADALAGHGIATFLHEWRGHGSSTLRAGRRHDWGYKALLEDDIPASEAAVARSAPGLPRIIGGHSIGGQLASCRLGLSPAAADALWLVASGAPYWRAFPTPRRWALPLAYRFMPWLAKINGHFPGKRLRFAGNEARGLIEDWGRTAISGRYAARGVDVDLEAALARTGTGIRAALMVDDWLAPRSSLDFLLSKMPRAEADVRTFDADHLGTEADHFAWMKQPAAVASWLAAGPRASGPPAGGAPGA